MQLFTLNTTVTGSREAIKYGCPRHYRYKGAIKLKIKKVHEHTYPILYFHLRKNTAFLLAPGVEFPRFGTEYNNIFNSEILHLNN